MNRRNFIKSLLIAAASFPLISYSKSNNEFINFYSYTSGFSLRERVTVKGSISHDGVYRVTDNTRPGLLKLKRG